MSEWNTLSTYLKCIWSSLKSVLVPVCAKLPFYLDRAVNQLIETHATVQRIIIVKWKCMYVCIYIYTYTVILMGRDMVAVCSMPFHLSETTERNKHHFKKWNLSFQSKCYAET